MVARSLAICLMLAGLVAPALADDDAPYVPPDFMAALPPLPPGVDASSAWRLDLMEALRIAMRDNLGIVAERDSVTAAQLGNAVAAGPFEPTLTASYDHGHSDSPPTTVQEGTAGEILSFVNDDWALSLGKELSTGLRLGLGFTSSRSQSSAGTAVEPLNYRSALTLSATQPILRGFSVDRVIPRIDVLRARITSDRERLQLAVAAAQIVEQTEDAYWGVVEALYRYDLQLRSMRRADEQLALTQRQIAAGVTPPSDLTSAEATLAQRKLALVQAEAGIDQAWDALRGVLHLPRDQWSRPILPVDMPQFLAEQTSASDQLAIALKHRPELGQLGLDVAAQELAVRKAENDELPEIDVGTQLSVIGQDAGYGGALAGVRSAAGKAYVVSVNMTWTPMRRATAATAEIQRVRLHSAVIQREQAEQDVWLAVRDAVRNQQTAARQVIAAGKFRELAEHSLDVEQRKFISGNSSNFFIAQRQEDLANAQLAELDAVLSHKKAIAAMLRANGTLLEQRRIVLDAK
jgi:outer membrane protein TolC